MLASAAVLLAVALTEATPLDPIVAVAAESLAEAPLDGPSARLLIETYARRDDLTRAVEVAADASFRLGTWVRVPNKERKPRGRSKVS